MITLSSIRSKKDNRILIIKNIHTKNESVSKNIYSETSEIFETNETNFLFLPVSVSAILYCVFGVSELSI